ncbi:hypothetical protein EST38_g10153 [Candolleomyces aberdarensis]|uniref:Uncharacterized protein n=1 Tax=Candolleomyces aberdarensis TaxID=2316362 RepID=A0A4Q2DBC4_9AGAR|nr:hypothetical protein EST38_g10153 [Candolleomyces aberdarensis]
MPSSLASHTGYSTYPLVSSSAVAKQWKTHRKLEAEKIKLLAEMQLMMLKLESNRASMKHIESEIYALLASATEQKQGLVGAQHSDPQSASATAVCDSRQQHTHLISRESAAMLPGELRPFQQQSYGASTGTLYQAGTVPWPHKHSVQYDPFGPPTKSYSELDSGNAMRPPVQTGSHRSGASTAGDRKTKSAGHEYWSRQKDERGCSELFGSGASTHPTQTYKLFVNYTQHGVGPHTQLWVRACAEWKNGVADHTTVPCQWGDLNET